MLPEIDDEAGEVVLEWPSPGFEAAVPEVRNAGLEQEAEVERQLLAAGWRTIDPAAMSLRDQVAAFKGALEVAGVHGAGLTGMVFAPPGTRVTSFAPAAMPDTFFWLLATLRGHRYVEVRARHRRGRWGDMDYDAALELPVAEVMDTLMGPGRGPHLGDAAAPG